MRTLLQATCPVPDCSLWTNDGHLSRHNYAAMIATIEEAKNSTMQKIGVVTIS